MGAGMAAGLLLSYFLLSNQVARSLVSVLDQQQYFLKMLFALFFLLGISGLGGALAGALAGWAIEKYSTVSAQGTSYIWRGALSFFIAHFVIVLPALAYALLTSFFHPDVDVSWTRLPQMFGALGVLYGLIGGALFGLLTVGLRRFLWIVLAAATGFGLGGLLLGLFIRLAADSDAAFTRLLWAMLGMFFFGALGGGALGFAFSRLHDSKPLFPDSRIWRWAVNLAIAAILFTGLVFLRNAIVLLTRVPGSLEPILVLPTQGTAWTVSEGTPSGIGLVAEPVEQARCEDGRVVVTQGGDEISPREWPGCVSDPLAARAGDAVHMVWYSTTVERNSGATSTGNFLLESILLDGAWTYPAIITQTGGPVQPELSSGANGELLMAWNDQSGPRYATMTPYQCDGVPEGRLAQVLYNVVREPQWRPASDPVTWCQNHFDRLHFTPNPKAPDTSYASYPKGAFSSVADLVRTAEYEVMFVTMQWDPPSGAISPGDTLAEAIGDLYANLQAHPEQYPRGLTVRILLGHYPETTLFQLANQVDYVITDLTAAGVDTFRKPEIGWELQLANFDGAWPHAHSKFVVVDGKSAVAAGFNYSYLHLPKEDPSGLGLDMTDMGIQITGPIAQSVLAAYDDLWSGSEQVACGRINYRLPVLFFFFCTSFEAQATHTPETLRFHPQEPSPYSSFALHHTPKHLESDEALLAVILAAEDTIDLFEVNFSLETACVVGILLDRFCTEEAAIPPYMEALRTAVIDHDVKLRVMMEATAMNGFENRLAVRWLLGEVDAAGKLDNVDLRFNSNKMHNKGVLIDRELLSVGSQNFHWSAWGDPSLTEYNMATDDPRAVTDFLDEYEYWWNLAIPAQEDNWLQEARAARGG